MTSSTVLGLGVASIAFVMGLASLHTVAGWALDDLRQIDIMSATADVVWIRQFGTSGGDSAGGVAEDASGTYVAGGTLDALPGQTSAGLDDAFVRKYDTEGNVLWTSQFGTPAEDNALDISVDVSGVYVAGYTFGSFPGEADASGSDAFVRRYDTEGNVLWTSQFGSSAGLRAQGIAAHASDVYAAGYTAGALSGQTSAGGLDAFVLKYDADGNLLWTSQFGSTADEWQPRIAVDASGVYIAGYTRGTLPGQTSSGFDDAFFRKYDLDGNVVWTRQFGTSTFDAATDVAVDASGVYVIGLTRGTLAGQTSVGGWDYYIQKYDGAGNVVWTRQFGSTDDDYGPRGDVDPSGVYVAGYTTGTIPGQTNAGLYDSLVYKYDTHGTIVWSRQFGTEEVDAAAGIAANPSEVYVVGSTSGAFPGQTNAGGADAFVVKLTGSDTGQDMNPPVLTVPADIVAEAIGPTGTVVEYTVTAQDVVDGAVGPVCSPPSGSTFPLGMTTVTCTASDSAGNGATASFTVSVRDTTNPNLLLPTDIVVQATDSSGAIVTFQVTAQDRVDPAPSLVCEPGSGSRFSVGETTITCSARDASGNVATGSFTVTVEGLEVVGQVGFLDPWIIGVAVIVIAAVIAAGVALLRRRKKE